MSSSKVDSDLLENIKEIILKFESFLKDAPNLGEAEHSLAQMEETDGNFHKYELVKSLRAQIEENLGPQVEIEIKVVSKDIRGDVIMDQEALVNQIIQKISSSPGFSALKTNLKGQIRPAVDYLVNNFKEEFVNGTGNGYTGGRSRRAGYTLTSDDVSSYASSLNQSGFLFLNQEQFLRVVDELDPRRPDDTRLRALQTLGDVPPSDILVAENWPQIKEYLVRSLGDKNDDIATRSLKIHAKLFSSPSPNTTKEVFSSLVEHLMSVFKMPLAKIPSLEEGIDSSQPFIARLLQRMRLLNDFQKEIPFYWIRCNEKFMEDVVTSAVSFLSMVPPKGSQTLTPLHFYALLDPKAIWFKRWMHGQYSRVTVLRLLGQKDAFIENILSKCIAYAEDLKEKGIVEASRKIDEFDGSPRKRVFTTTQVKYAHFIHSICMIERLLKFKQGREIVAKNLKNNKDGTVAPLVCALVQVITAKVGYRSQERKESRFDPTHLICFTLKNLSRIESACQACLCHEQVISTLLKPIQQCITTGKDPAFLKVDDKTLLYIADILACFVSTASGKRHFLHSDQKSHINNALYIVTTFVAHSLSGKLKCSQSVTEMFLSLFQQLLPSMEGLRIFEQLKLHETIAEAWERTEKEAERAATPTQEDTMKPEKNPILWADCLLENLINLTASPRGLLLLQSTGLIEPCVSHMQTRYRQKMQVSRYERFGYGLMVTQVAATAVGMEALNTSGFIETLINKVWSEIESGSHVSLLFPKPYPTDVIDRYTQKPFAGLLNVVSSFQGVFELVCDTRLGTTTSFDFNTPPDGFVQFIDRTIFINNEEKCHFLFNQEQSHCVGLRFLSYMVSDLDTLLLLETHYKFLDSLLASQEGNKHDNGLILIDMPSMERNYVLVKCYLIGGPTERTLPERTVGTTTNTLAFPLFSSYPVPREYLTTALSKSTAKQENELVKLLKETKAKKPDEEWLQSCRESYLKVLAVAPDSLRGTFLSDFLLKLTAGIAIVKEEALPVKIDMSFKDAVAKSETLTDMQNMGIKLAIRYGTQMKLLTSVADSSDNLASLIKAVDALIKTQRLEQIDTNIKFLRHPMPGFDWLTGTIFLMMGGDKEKAWSALVALANHVSSILLWPQRWHLSAHFNESIVRSAIHPLFFFTCHHVEYILEVDLPLVHSAFRMSGFTPSQICQHWMKQCFWNYLDWMDICHYVLLCLVQGIDYQVYFCVAILKFLEKDIMLHSSERDLQLFLMENAITGFHVSQNIAFMQTLEEKYRKPIYDEALNLTKFSF